MSTQSEFEPVSNGYSNGVSRDSIFEALGGNNSKVREQLGRMLADPSKIREIAQQYADTLDRISARNEYLDIDKLTAYQILLATGAVRAAATKSWVAPDYGDGRMEGGGPVTTVLPPQVNKERAEWLIQKLAQPAQGQGRA